jgi:hypothetical protein
VVDLTSNNWSRITVSYLLDLDEPVIYNGPHAMAVHVEVALEGGRTPDPLLAKVGGLPTVLSPRIIRSGVSWLGPSLPKRLYVLRNLIWPTV